MRLTRPGADAAALGVVPNVSRNRSIAGRGIALTMIPANATVSRPYSPSHSICLRRTRMRRFAFVLLAGAFALVAASPAPPHIFFFQAEDGIRDVAVTGVQTCALPI